MLTSLSVFYNNNSNVASKQIKADAIYNMNINITTQTKTFLCSKIL
jgi:hypothetical protein